MQQNKINIQHFVNRVLDCRGTRKTANIHKFIILSRITGIKINVEFAEHSALHM